MGKRFGIDYSRGQFPGVQALLDAGVQLVGRYAVDDVSPDGRGLTTNEWHALDNAGIDVFLYWEAEEAWMLGGESRGVAGAQNAVRNIARIGMPPLIPVYFSHDIDPLPRDFAAIDACLNGAASVIGEDRVCFYGGWLGVDHVLNAGTARKAAQTIAWEYGRGLHPGACIYQYDTSGNFIGGLDVDLLETLCDDFGQASLYRTKPTTTTTTTTLPPGPAHRIPAPDRITAQGHRLVKNEPNRFKCIQGGHFKTAPDMGAPNGTETPYQAGHTYTFDYRSEGTINGRRWYVSKAGSWAPVTNFEPA